MDGDSKYLKDNVKGQDQVDWTGLDMVRGSLFEGNEGQRGDGKLISQ